MLTSAIRFLAIFFVLLLLSAVPRVRTSAQSTLIIVNSSEDSIANDGKCTLREAIIAANENAASGTAVGECVAGKPGKDQIVFSLGIGTPVINVVNMSFANLALPPVLEPISINGHTGGASRIEIHAGVRLLGGLYIGGGDSVVSSLVITGFEGFALQLTEKGGNAVEDCYIGLDASGQTAASNGYGVYVTSPNNRIGGTDPARHNVISGNSAYGILLDTEAAGCQVQGNYIGTNVDGTAAVGNGTGLVIFSPNNIIGGKTAEARNLISGNQTAGIAIGGLRGFNTLQINPTGNQVMGNFIGVDVTGLAKLGNGTNGISLINGASRNVIGDEQIGGRNVISGNGQNGIEVYCYSLSFAESAQPSVETISRIIGNNIGVDKTGKAKLANGSNGISMNCGDAYIIGGDQTGARNIISGNQERGILISPPGMQPVSIMGNFIGVDETGTVGIGNGLDGIVAGSSSNVEVGGTTPGAGNLISANSGSGVHSLLAITAGNFIGTDITGTKALGNGVGVSGGGRIGGTTPAARNIISGNRFAGVALTGSATLMGNYIGTDVSGTAPLPNLGTGVAVGGGNNVIGGFVPGARNIISGNAGQGIYLSGGAIIAGNYIGLDVTGSTAIGNLRGIEIASSYNTIGTSEPIARNVISGNLQGGIRITGAQTVDNYILNNFIGTNAAGTASVGPSDYGVSIEDAYFNYIGGPNPGEGNLISGNTNSGVLITGISATQNRVTGNYIGVDVTGTKAVPNNDGVLIAAASFNVIGGTSQGLRNVISGNNRHGILITGTNTQGNSDNMVTGNFIGLNAAGTAAVGNRMHGIWLTQGTAHNIIGGADPTARNVISGNEGNGIQIENASRSRVIGNFIGTDAQGVNDVGNLQNGVVMAGIGFSEVGGTGAGEGNVIAFNRKNGVLRATVAGTILSNSIFSNGEMGINLGSSTSMFYTPLLASASSSNGQTLVQGTIVSAPKTSFLIQFFLNLACDSSGAGEGKTLIGQQTVTAADSQQNSVTTPFLATLPTAALPGQVITATATWFSDPLIDFTRMTSRFSACVGLAQAAITISDITVTEGSYPNNTAAAFTFTLTGAQGIGQPIKVDYATSDGTARSFLDYVETRGTLTFNPPFSSGQITQTVFVTIVSDNEEEPPENFSLNLSSPVNAFLQKAQGTGVILDTSNRFNAPGNRLPDNAAISDQKAGSLLIFPVYTSSAASPNSQNTRISLTNAANSRSANVRLFFVNGATGAVADLFICLTPNQTSVFLISDIDPGVTGFLITVAVDGAGCPTRHNVLVGDEYVKFTSGHAANLGALAVAALKDKPTTCPVGSQLAELRFDDVSYNALPRSVAASNLAARSTGNDSLLVLNRLDGNLAAGAPPLGAVSGLLIDDIENNYSFTFNASSCQFISAINGNFPRTNPRFDQIILSGRSGWMKLWTAEDVPLCGALINFNGNFRASAAAFNQGHNLHALATTTAGQFTVPIVTPPCL